MKATRGGEAGFSLIEVMAAVVVLAIAVTVLLKLSSAGLRLAKAVEDKTVLVAAADRTMRAFWTEGMNTEGYAAKDGDIECRAVVLPFRQNNGGPARLSKIIVTARNVNTGAEYKLMSLKGE